MRKKKKKNFIRKKVFLIVVLGILIMIIGKLNFNIKPPTAQMIQDKTGVPYKVDHITDSNKRSRKKMLPIYIVVHNTANEKSTAQNERDYLMNPLNMTSTSWNIAVDDQGAVEAIPTNEMAFHSGTHKGNRMGIGIEICESGDYKKAEENAAKIIAYLKKYYHISNKNIKTHRDFSGKECPRKILGRWTEFTQKINSFKYQ